MDSHDNAAAFDTGCIAARVASKESGVMHMIGITTATQFLAFPAEMCMCMHMFISVI
jgi:hypothetical protein